VNSLFKRERAGGKKEGVGHHGGERKRRCPNKQSKWGKEEGDTGRCHWYPGIKEGGGGGGKNRTRRKTGKKKENKKKRGACVHILASWGRGEEKKERYRGTAFVGL